MDLASALKKYFGYDAFRPLQEEIIRDALAGRDVFALMPTGGGKSLCFQLPALLRDGLTIVVSPLISLMKDQVDALQTSGIAATFLNSALDRHEAVERLRRLNHGEYRLLYVAPERLMLDGFLERALNWNIAQIAIDEAHCISEWGHDFRPEYRELKKLRRHLPDVPIIALTATATECVRKDIVDQLHLRSARCYVASFNRANLTYRVVPKSSPYEQVLKLIRGRPNESGIVFSASDVVKQRRFIEEKSEREQCVAQEQLRDMIHYAETRDCRRATLLKYFGEEFSASCSGCDNCMEPRETFDGTVRAQKFLSCIYRIYEKHGFGFGLNHVVDVLAGAETEGIRQRGHDELSTYGIGRDVKRTAWLAIGRELLRLGLIAAAPGKFATLQLTEAGRAALRERKPITLTKPFDVDATKRSKKHRAGHLECDETLFAQLRVLRRRIADERDVPAYVIFSDVSLREMARVYPTTSAEFGRIPGVGQQKLRDFAEPFTSVIRGYLMSNPRQPRVSNLRD